jgi:hypothetical protein
VAWAPPPPPRAGGAPALTSREGHNRFVWDLRYPRPRTQEYEYSIAAVPGQPTALLPAGPYVLPGRYELRLTVDSQTVRQTLTVAQDPRRHETPDELRALLELQRETITSLEAAADGATEVARIQARLAALDDNPRARGARPLVAQVRRGLEAIDETEKSEALDKLDQRLRALETDLESGDAPPTGGQRQLLAGSRPRLASALGRLAAVRSGPLARLDARLRALAVTEPPIAAPAKEERSDDVP